MKKWVLIIILILIVVFAGGLFLMHWGIKNMGNLETSVKIKEESYVKLDLSESIPEKSSYSFEGFTFRKGPNFLDLLTSIKNAGEDSRIKGIILEPGACAVSMSQAEEILNSLVEFKANGKEIIAFLESVSLRSLHLTSVADKVYLVPTGSAIMPGFNIEGLFLKNAMDKLGVSWNVIQMGKYKGAMEIFTDDTFTAPTREVYNSILDDLMANLLSHMEAINPDYDREKINAAMDKAILNGQELVKMGFVDSLLYYREFKEMLELDEEKNLVSMKDYISSTQSKKGGDKKVAILYALGGIHTGKSESSPFGGRQSIGSATLSRGILEAAEDDEIEAIIMRVESGGGSALASDIIWDAMNKAREKKPVVVTMGGVAASGGYYISMAADSILADPSSITGSIGVIFGQPNLKGLYNKLGITKQSISRGKHAGMFSDYKNLSTEERGILTAYLEEIYNDFVSKAAADREMAYEDLEVLAQGRVWTGNQAAELKLIDRTGGFMDAINVAKKLIGVPLQEKIKLVEFPKKKGGFQFKFNLGIKTWMRGFIFNPDQQDILNLLWETSLYPENEPLALMPYRFRF